MATVLKIIEQFNEAVKHIQRANESARQGDLPTAQAELGKSSSCIYSTIEWATKNYLRQKFPNGKKFPKEYSIINANNFHDKLDLFQQHARPSFKDVNINVKVIKELKQSVRNDPEHSGYIPHYESLLQVVEQGRIIVKNYIDSSIELNKIPEFTKSEIPSDSNWSEFYRACDSFDKNKNYILLIGPTSEFSPDKLSYLGLLDWTLIIDFNPETEITGLFKNAADQIENRKNVHLITCEDKVSFSPYNSLYWLAANGLKGRKSTLIKDYRDWIRKNLSYLNNFFNHSFRLSEISLIILL